MLSPSKRLSLYLDSFPNDSAGPRGTEMPHE